MSIDVLHGDCLEVMRALPDNSIHAVVTDPPYGLSFMGKHWDKGVPGVPFWTEMLRVLKPGGHLLSFAGSRTYHRMAVAIEDAGFEVRDQIMWVYGSGFPKSLDISKDLDRMAGAEREVIGKKLHARDGDVSNQKWSDNGSSLKSYVGSNQTLGTGYITAPTTDAAKQWQGWHTALKPSHEPLCLARKPLSEKTVAANVLKHGTGGLNVDKCRVEGQKRNAAYREEGAPVNGGSMFGNTRHVNIDVNQGRWPANLIHDGSQEVLELFPTSSSRSGGTRGKSQIWGNAAGQQDRNGYDDAGSAARFFYTAKASRAERQGSKHPTIKPLSLMRYLVRLITPPGGTVLDPFAGSGTTGQAALLEGFKAILIEREAEYIADIKQRLGMEAVA